MKFVQNNTRNARQRRIIWWYYQRTLPAKMATRVEVRGWFENHGKSLWDDAGNEYDNAIENA